METKQKKHEKSAPAIKGVHPNYTTTAGDSVRVVSIVSGSKSASELIHEAAVKKILYEGQT